MDIEQFYKYLPKSIKSALMQLENIIVKKITEIRIRRDLPLGIIVNNTTYFIDKHGNLYDYLNDKIIFVASSEIDDIFLKLCEYSIYSNMDSLTNGYITLSNGARVGVGATAVYDGKEIISVKSITSINIRVPRDIKGISSSCLNTIIDDDLPSIIIAGPPNSGKTTFLRDVARNLSNGLISNFFKVSIVDERNEIAPKDNENLVFDVGINTDVLSGYKKSKGIEIATRVLSPDIIICDEISTIDELNSIKHGFSSGVSFALSIHIKNEKQLLTKPILYNLLTTNEFDYIVLLDKHTYSQRIFKASEILSEINRINRDNYNDNKHWNLLFE